MMVFVERSVKTQMVETLVEGGLVITNEGDTLLIITNLNLQGDLRYAGTCSNILIDKIVFTGLEFNREEIVVDPLVKDISFLEWYKSSKGIKDSIHIQIKNKGTIYYKMVPRGERIVTNHQAIDWGWWGKRDNLFSRNFSGLTIESDGKIFDPERVYRHKLFSGSWNPLERKFQFGDFVNADELSIMPTWYHHQIGSPHVLTYNEISHRERFLYNNTAVNKDYHKVLYAKVNRDLTFVVKGYC